MPPPRRDAGYTLAEMMVVLALMGIMMAISVGGWRSWATASAHSGTASEIQAVLRQAQQRAITEGRSTCVLFDDAADTYRVYSGRCSESTKVLVSGPYETGSGDVSIDAPSFTSAAGTQAPGVSFRSRGTGSPGSVRVTREGSSKVYVVSVEGLTGRVSVS